LTLPSAGPDIGAMALLADRRFWTVPNALSLSRLALIPVWWWVMISPAISDWWGAAIIVYAIISDVADGYLARRLQQVTQWGKALDPLGDKIAALALGIFCVVHRELPLWALAVTVGRDILLVVGGWMIYRRQGSLPSSINIGRYAALVWGIVLLFYAFAWYPYAQYLLWPGLALYIMAGVMYLQPFLASRGA
jgi:cardiolipin synthase